MPSEIQNYRPQLILRARQKQARTAWMVSALLVAGWVFLILLAPLAKANEWIGVAEPIYSFFSYLCHQAPERSLALGGSQLAVCSRCLGVYAGLLSGFVGYPLFRPLVNIEPLPRLWLFLSLIPIGFDWSLGILGVWENTHFSRIATGLILGVMCAIFIIPAIIELGWLVSERTQNKGLPG